MEWTDAQRAAIDLPRRDVLVAAAAGSGKTATLTERVLLTVCREKDPVDINRLLILTYTEKAAEELRVRIRNKLAAESEKDPGNGRIRRQLSLLPSASVSTIHSFYGRVIREGGPSLGLPPKLRTITPEESGMIKRRVMNDVIDAAYENGGGAYDAAELFETFEKTRPGEALTDVLLELYDEVTSYPEFIGFYDVCRRKCEAAAEDFTSSEYYAYIREDGLRRVGAMLDRICEFDAEFCGDDLYCAKYRPKILSYETYLKRAAAALRGGYADAYAFFREAPEITAFSRVSGDPPFKDPAKKLCVNLDKRISAIADGFSFCPEDTAMICRDTAALCGGIYEFLRRFDEALSAEKLEAAVIDFADMERIAYRLICEGDGSVARRLAEKYDELYIDEYQDVNAIQDAIFAALGRNNRFMVGDVKQSIYSFRGSDPTIFSAYRKKFKPYDGEDPGPSVIFLSENFRCGKPVIDFTNEVFAGVFGSGGPVPYEKSDALVFGKKCGVPGDVPVQVRIFPGGTAEDEARYAANEIKKLLRYGRKDDGGRMTPSDIAVLCRSGDTCQVAEKVFTEAGLGCVNTSDKSFFDSAEVLLAVSLLSAIDNPVRDVPLAAVMKSPVFGFSLDELARIRLHTPDGPLIDAVRAYAEDEDDAKCAQMLSRLDRFRYLSRTTRVDKFIRRLLKETSLYAAICGEDDGVPPEDRRANLETLCELARDYESGSFKGLYGFVSYCAELIAQQKSSGVAADPSGRVTVQTIHGSKGLEYSAVFVLGCDRKFNSEHSRKSIIADRKLGLGIRVKDADGAVRVGPVYRAAVIKRNNDGVRDEACLFYVALTRAKKYLFVTASPKDEPEFKGGATADDVYNCHSFLDFLTVSLDGNGGSYAIGYGPADEEEETETAAATAAETAAADPERLEELKRIYEYEYPYAEAARLPKKASVSSLYPSFLDDDGDHFDPFADDGVKPLILPDYAEGEKEADAAARGTATHLFMQFCDFESAKTDARAEADRLVRMKFIKEDAKELIRYDEVGRFFDSPLYGRMKAAVESGRLFCREYRFNAELDAAGFTEDEERKKALLGEKLLVQGVIDCFFEEEDGSITVVDYKTDRIGYSAEAVAGFADRHRRQLGYYTTAVKSIVCTENVSAELYSFCIGRSVKL